MYYTIAIIIYFSFVNYLQYLIKKTDKKHIIRSSPVFINNLFLNNLKYVIY